MSRLLGKTLGILTVLFGGIALFSSVGSALNIMSVLEKENTQQGIALADSLGVLIGQNTPPNLLERMVRHHQNKRGVEYIIIRNDHHQIVINSIPGPIPEPLAMINPHRTAKVSKIALRDAGSVIDIQRPTDSGWSVQVGVNQTWITKEAIMGFWIQQGVIFIVFLFTILLARWWINQLSAPLRTLTRYARALGQHHFDRPSDQQGAILQIAKTNRDEVGMLAQAITRMENQLCVTIQHMTQTAATQERLSSELAIARTIQMTMVPRDFPLFPQQEQWQLFAHIEPAKAVGGDFYDFMMSDDGQTLYFCIGDVSGKGMPAALLMVMTTTLWKADATTGLLPHQLLEKMNKTLCDTHRAGLFVTMISGQLDLQTGLVTLSVAGHTPPIVCHASESRWVSVEHGMPLGIEPIPAYQSHTVSLCPQDQLVLYTDGITEARNQTGDFFGDEALLTACRGAAPPQEKTQALMQQLAQFVGEAPQSDDLTVAIIGWHPPTESSNPRFTLPST